MPIRSREHELADEAVRAFASVLGSRFKFYERPQPEYGIDGDVEEFDDDRRATGLQFFAQVKGTDEEEEGKALAKSIPLETAAYYRASPMPVLMVRYHAPADTVYTRWFHQYDPYYGRGGEKTLTFRWQLDDRWTSGSADRLAAEARSYYELRNAALEVPRPVYLVSEGAFGVTDAEFRIALRSAARRRSEILQVEGGAPPPGAAWIEVREDAIVAHLGTVTAATLHLPDEGYDADATAQQVAVDSLALLALAFERVRQDTIASRLAATYLPDAVLVTDIEAAFAVSSSMVRAHRVGQALELADELDDPDDPDRSAAAFVIGLAVLYASDTLTDDELDRHENVLKNRVKRRKKLRPVEAGHAAMNLATFQRRRWRPDKAVSHYENALRLDPGYGERAHFWFEYAGALWGTGQYQRAAEAYGRAIELGSNEPLALALQADCLMYAGRYAEALHTFKEFHDQGGAEHEDGEYRLKVRALSAIIDRLGMNEQSRRPGRVLGVVEEEADPQTAEGWTELSLQQLREDALWGSAWLNLGVSDSDHGDHQAALGCHIASTILIPADHEAWANAIFTALECAEFDVLADLVIVGRRLGGDGLVDELLERVKRTGDASVIAAFTKALDATIQEAEVRGPPRLTLRMLSEDGAVEEIVLGEPRTPPPSERQEQQGSDRHSLTPGERTLPG